MSPHYPDFLSSKTFKIQSRDKSFIAHSDILAAQSEPFRRTIREVWKNAAEETIDLSDWDGDTVARFLQFLYVKDYQFPKSMPEDGEQGNGGEAQKEKIKVEEEKRGGSEVEKEEEEDGEVKGLDGFNTPDTVQGLGEQEQSKSKQDVNVLLVHAKLYALAQDKEVEALRIMALERLRETGILKGAPAMTVSATAKVIELLKYFYSHTSPRTSPEDPMHDFYTSPPTSPEDPMRNFLSLLAAENVEALMGREEMGFLLREGGDFTVELMEKVAKRFCDMERLCVAESVVQEWKSKAAEEEEKVRRLESQIRRLEAKVEWFSDACPNKARQYERMNLNSDLLEF